ncbi:pentapeptide repeat-containing protein [Actinoallomurus iriomotensis]|uniref:pentapeptide repeat-containing protein n=1 Tax=Actinoallomurus iriomotensis TaxID=478107 RepID=UPI003D7FBCC8
MTVLPEVVLPEAILPGTALPGTALTGAALPGAALTGAASTRAASTGAALSGATLTGAALSGATSTRAALTRTALTGAALSGTALTRTALARAAGAALGGKALTRTVRRPSVVSVSLAAEVRAAVPAGRHADTGPAETGSGVAVAPLPGAPVVSRAARVPATARGVVRVTAVRVASAARAEGIPLGRRVLRTRVAGVRAGGRHRTARPPLLRRAA